MVREKEWARLVNALQVPLIVEDILEGRERMDSEVRAGLHEILSEFHPDSALLCLALSARRMAVALAGRYKTMLALKMESERLIDEYAPLWLDHAGHRPIDDNTLFETLSRIPEDLESLSELLEMDAAVLRREEPDLAMLCSVLAIQGRAQALVAESYVEAMETEEQKDMASLMPVYCGNVIPFPVQRVRA